MGGMFTIKNKGGLWHCYTHINIVLYQEYGHWVIDQTSEDWRIDMSWLLQGQEPVVSSARCGSYPLADRRIYQSEEADAQGRWRVTGYLIHESWGILTKRDITY